MPETEERNKTLFLSAFTFEKVFNFLISFKETSFLKVYFIISYMYCGVMNVCDYCCCPMFIRPRVKRTAGSAVDLAVTLTSSHQQNTSLSSSVTSASAATSVTDVRFAPNLTTTLWTNGDQLRQSLPFSKHQLLLHSLLDSQP